MVNALHSNAQWNALRAVYSNFERKIVNRFDVSVLLIGTLIVHECRITLKTRDPRPLHKRFKRRHLQR